MRSSLSPAVISRMSIRLPQRVSPAPPRTSRKPGDMSAADFVKFDIASDGSSLSVEKSFSKATSIRDLKMKLELLTGKSIDSMRIALLSEDRLISDNIASEENRPLESFLPSTWEKLTLRVSGMDMAAEDESAAAVPKFELTDEAYEQRGESLRKFKMEQKLGRFDPEKAAAEQLRQQAVQQRQLTQEREDSRRFKINDRCEVRVDGVPARRGTIMYSGTTDFKPGFWIGVKYDEPVGKNDGSVGGRRYFHCQPKYGSFVKPEHVTVGHFPEEDPFADVE